VSTTSSLNSFWNCAKPMIWNCDEKPDQFVNE